MANNNRDAIKDLRAEALEYHAFPKPGKIGVELLKPAETQNDLSLAYSPGGSRARQGNFPRPRKRLPIHQQGQSCCSHLQRQCNIGSGQSRPIVQQAGYGRKELAVQALCRYRFH